MRLEISVRTHNLYVYSAQVFIFKSMFFYATPVENKRVACLMVQRSDPTADHLHTQLHSCLEVLHDVHGVTMKIIQTFIQELQLTSSCSNHVSRLYYRCILSDRLITK